MAVQKRRSLGEQGAGAALRLCGRAGAVGLFLTLWTSAALGQTASLAAFNGQKLAERHCGGCHAIASGPSPLADAPPFANLHRRYFEGGLDQILSEGMLAPTPKPWPQPLRTHPRMPMARLTGAEVADLKAYLASLDPRRPGARDCYVTSGRRGACPRDVQR